MARTVESVLGTFGEDDATVRLIWTVFGAVPGGPQLSFYHTLDEARWLVAPDLDDAAFARAQALLTSRETQQALDVADAIDTGDVGITVLTGVRSAFSFFFGDRSKALDTDAQQGADAALKAAAIAWMTMTLLPGSVPERVRALRALPSGEALLTWYAAVEIALPFADGVAAGTGSIVGRLLEKYGGANLARLDGAAGAGASAAAQGMLGGLTEPVEQLVRSMSGHTQRIAESARQWLPPALATAGTVAGAAATAADAMPVYRLLGARLCAEAALARARA
ncbi:MAG: hypothetical protein ACOZNI_27760 [Myxococcota bacterium]